MTKVKVPNSNFTRNYIIYHRIDRVTGGYEVIKEYMDMDF